jgi:AcrR family transcriptional regulator
MARAGLHSETVIAAAAAIADAEGFDNVSLARLASELGVRPPSLYTHVGGIEDVRRRLGVVAKQQLAARLGAAAAGRARGDALAAVAAAYRDYARAHPGSYAAAQRVGGTDDESDRAAATAVADVVVAVLRGYGLEGDDAIHAVRGVSAALDGFVAIEAAGGFGIPVSVDESFDRLVALLDRGLADT